MLKILDRWAAYQHTRCSYDNTRAFFLDDFHPFFLASYGDKKQITVVTGIIVLYVLAAELDLIFFTVAALNTKVSGTGSDRVTSPASPGPKLLTITV